VKEIEGAVGGGRAKVEVEVEVVAARAAATLASMRARSSQAVAGGSAGQPYPRIGSLIPCRVE
jgi:hypothetical protein